MAVGPESAWKYCVNQCAELYRTARYQLFAEALRERGGLYERALALRQQALEELRRDEALRRRFARFLASLARARRELRGWFRLVRLAPEDFLHAEGRLLPIPVSPPFLSGALPRPATEMLLRLPGLRGWRRQMEELFARSKFQTGNLLYRTSLHRGRPIIEGDDGCSLSAMAGIAHELGHCLAESGALRGRPGNAVYSESAAHFFEEAAVHEHLELEGRASERAAWGRYQRKVDACNLLFFREEAHALTGSPAPRPRWFAGGTSLFRESLYTMPGYQLIYARASLARWRWLTGKKRLADFLPAGGQLWR